LSAFLPNARHLGAAALVFSPNALLNPSNPSFAEGTQKAMKAARKKEKKKEGGVGLVVS
jgi:hypothetical protein